MQKELNCIVELVCGLFIVFPKPRTGPGLQGCYDVLNGIPLPAGRSVSSCAGAPHQTADILKQHIMLTFVLTDGTSLCYIFSAAVSLGSI